jgi:5'-AMP-activated protein kinase catalytic alpha subunit
MGSNSSVKESNLIDKYHLSKLLGQGAYSKVYHGRNLKTGESVAIKVLKKEEILAKTGRVDRIKTEISVMRTLRHPNIVQLYEVMADKNKIYFVMEYVNRGDFLQMLQKLHQEEKQLDEDTARKYFQQLISAMDFCHSRGVYHRDLKPDNILLDDNGNIKIVDFGLSAIKENVGNDGLLHTRCGTPGYFAPEIVNGAGYDGVKADVWSCGVMLYILISGCHPFSEFDLMPLFRQMCSRDFIFPLESFQDEVGSLLFKMLDPNPNTRITIPQIMQVPWFRVGFDDNMSAEFDSCDLSGENVICPDDLDLVFRDNVN